MTESTTRPAAAVQPGAAGTGRLEAAHDRYRSQRSFGALDGLRCICIVAVVWHHARPVTDLPTLATRGRPWVSARCRQRICVSPFQNQRGSGA